ncbi:MAG: hypothetical protein JSV88_32985 [Candidatus Aminicenantes bacterium]|nr:MAG: hypothetical protein JSV88_32985 [Candidatus Aminicenantes bacterium]
MPKEFDITVENKLMKERRYINVYHQATRSAHLISHDSSVTLPLGTAKKNDYLYISGVRSHGNLWAACLINVPSWADFEFSLEGKVIISHSHDDDRTILKIPPGPPTWQLKIKQSTTAPGKQSLDNVTIADNGPGGGKK